MKDYGIVFNIQRFCVNDGPGIRTLVFLKGCNLHCAWCHNPESIKVKPELSFCEEKCVNCGECAKVCRKDGHCFENGKHILQRTNCVGCGECQQMCYSGSLELIGKRLTAAQVIEKVLKDKSFYESSGGGVTFSGGEPFVQFDFLSHLLYIAKQHKLHTAIETNGCASARKIKAVADNTDIFLVDYKMSDFELSKNYIGAEYKKVMDTFILLSELNKKVILRCPIIPGLNDNLEHFHAIADLAEQYRNIDHVEIEPYHPLGVQKAKNIGMVNMFHLEQMPSEEEVNDWIHFIQSRTIKKVERG